MAENTSYEVGERRRHMLDYECYRSNMQEQVHAEQPTLEVQTNQDSHAEPGTPQAHRQ